ncbi:TonB-dependent receptor [Methylophaga thalassica]|uniref:TonB-dependent receptor n=1 Tax=Methylophaga thalassica TaxID=40223 RepID=UPI002E7B4B04|nr:TonB-dependent receptor [Methylophaga thalassica]WVI86691.1 TonB-dependent receptor [Methylophaga thalassica]
MRMKSTCVMMALIMGGMQVSLADEETSNTSTLELDTLSVTASADASAEGLSPAFAGGQVAEGGRAGILGTKDNLDTPFSITSYTNEFIQDRQAQSVGDVLRYDPTVQVTRGFGNFQEAYMIRGFTTSSDAVAYNGLYNLLPRQYIATELFERVEVLRGASAFLTGANPLGGAIGGSINLLPKRAPNYDLNRVTIGASMNDKRNIAADIARRFGDNDEFGVRVNAAHHNGGTSIDDEQAELNLFNIGLDYQGERLRLSADIGYQNNQLDHTRTNVTISGLSKVPSAPDASNNWAQPWSYSNEEDKFGTFRAEYDLTDEVTAWAAYGMRRSEEENSLANLTLSNANSGDGTFYRFDNAREDRVDTGEIGLRGHFDTGLVGHEWVVAYSYFQLETKNGYTYDFTGTQTNTNIYQPQYVSKPAFTSSAVSGNNFYSPSLNTRTKFNSFAIGDTLSFIDERLQVTIGARHQAIKVDNYKVNTGVRTSYEDSKITPALGTVFNLTDEISIYANYIESLVAGGKAPDNANGAPVINAGESMSPYVSEQREVGLKYETEKFGTGLAYFTTDEPRTFTGTDQVFRESGENEHQGVELTLYGKATDNLKLLGGITWLDAKQKGTGKATTEGKRAIGVAEWMAVMGAEWEVPEIKGLALDGQIHYVSSRYANATNTLKLDDWTTVGLGARYLINMGNQDLTLRARVDNLFDRDYWSSANDSGQITLGAPRTVSISATVDFY